MRSCSPTRSTRRARSTTRCACDLASGQDLPLAIEQTEDAAWGNDSRTLYYLTKDEAKRTHRVWRHRLGAGTPDELLFEESDELFWLGLGKTRDERWIVVSSGSKDTTELRVIDADDPTAAPRVVIPRRSGIEMSLDHRHGRFYLLVNDTGRNFRLVETPADTPSLDAARELIAHRDDVMLEDVDLFERWMVVQERDRGTLKLRVFEWVDGRWGRDWHIPFDETVYSAGGDVNAEFASDVYRVGYTSMVTPHSIYDVDLRSGERTLMKRQPVLGGYDPALYDSTQLMSRAADGTEVPISLVWKRELRRGQPQPLLMYGYGAYGIPVDPYFVVTAEPARPRRGLRHRPRAWRRRPRPALVRRRQAGQQAEQLQRPGGLRRGAGGAGLDHARAADHRRRQRRRAAGRGSGQPAAGSVPRRRGRGALRRRGQHHARRVAAADGRRVPRVGQPEGTASLCGDPQLLAIRQPARGGLPGDVPARRTERQPCRTGKRPSTRRSCAR
ncbi:S9 family peptidase [Piscinibacter aquaticus]|uniref:S9 family peptidase n=1 Tax=Piscinibacter aquaticus TaxID=392597 RepID=A0A5C6U0T9_9BURK|nr:S9 family peptidase [Piscinibacter aquaticus]